jgi:hypothetical protein
MLWLRWIIILLALQEAGWMTLDGSRALIVGDYVTPARGRHAGQLGPWSKVATAVGIQPRSTLMKTIFVVYGVVWLLVTTCFMFKFSWAWYGMLTLAVGSLWYLPVGTAFSVIQIGLLLILELVKKNGSQNKQ